MVLYMSPMGRFSASTSNGISDLQEYTTATAVVVLVQQQLLSSLLIWWSPLHYASTQLHWNPIRSL